MRQKVSIELSASFNKGIQIRTLYAKCGTSLFAFKLSFHPWGKTKTLSILCTAQQLYSALTAAESSQTKKRKVE